MQNNRKSLRKILKIAGVCLLFICVMAVLRHNIGNAWNTTDYHPSLTDSPVYVEFSPESPLVVNITPNESFTMNSLDMVLVNISDDSRGTLQATLSDSTGNILSTDRISLSDISVGSWQSLAMRADLEASQEYAITFSVDAGNPYFMRLDASANSDFPYTLTVAGHGKDYISLGLQKAEITTVSFGDVFYYSVPISVILFLILLAWAIFDTKFTVFVKSIPIKKWIHAYGNEIFLIVTYIVLCISIYSRAYAQSVYITSDSTGYMREAINLVNGNGFSYDGLAGYHTWFANWPILYPVMIAVVMFITGTNAYLSTKILSMILLLIIMIIIYVYAKKDAWIYSLALLNTGFITLLWSTWSELPFMLFLMCFGLFLGAILKDDSPKRKNYVFLGLSTVLVFFTRYYGLFLFFVLAPYIAHYFISWLKHRGISAFHKWINLTITSSISGIICLAYLIMNKFMNGMASGVARTMWWDDYGILTDDLITSLETEFFHIFSLETPDLIKGFPVSMQVWVLFIILISLGILISHPLKKLNEHSVWIVMAIIYDILFIGIRYFSSMDSFYFRFFEPATFLLTLGILGYLIPHIRTHSLIWPGLIIFGLIVISGASLIVSGSVIQKPYYTELTAGWDEAYSEIPEKSVIIFSDMDFRSGFYRPDVVDGAIDPSMDMAAIRETYYGSDNMCITVTNAKNMVETPVYPEDVDSAIKEALSAASPDSKYIVIKLH